MMWQQFGPSLLTPWGLPFGFLLFLPLLIWSFVWKGVALWHAARRQEGYWFVAILLLNTLGILEIAYLYVFHGREDLTPPKTA